MKKSSRTLMITVLISTSILSSGCGMLVYMHGTGKFEREQRKASGMSRKEWENRPRIISTERVESRSGDYFLRTWNDGTTKKVPAKQP